MIEGVQVTSRKVIPDERGKIMHIMKSSDDQFNTFGEVYCSSVYPGVVKGWHMHKKMTLNYVVLKGNIKFVLYDDRPESKTYRQIQEIVIGENHYVMVTVPPLVWNGFKGIGSKVSIVANCATIPHDPAEIERKSAFDNSIPYDWEIKHK